MVRLASGPNRLYFEHLPSVVSVVVQSAQLSWNKCFRLAAGRRF